MLFGFDTNNETTLMINTYTAAVLNPSEVSAEREVAVAGKEVSVMGRVESFM